MPINIIDNIQVEHLEESFHVTLERLPTMPVANMPDGVILRRNKAEVIIVDDDGKPLPKVVRAFLQRSVFKEYSLHTGLRDYK